MKHLTYILLASLLLTIGLSYSAHAGGKNEEPTKEQKQRHYRVSSEKSTVISMDLTNNGKKSLPEQLRAIYESTKDYSKPDYTISTGGSVNLGKSIWSRCLIIFGCFILIYLAVKVLPVMYSPDKELDSKFWVKPALLALFLACYPQFMGFTDKCMQYLSFADQTSQNIQIVRETNTKMTRKWWANTMKYKEPEYVTTSYDTVTYDLSSLIRGTISLDKEIGELQEYEEMMETVRSGEPLSKEQQEKATSWWACHKIGDLIPNILDHLFAWAAEIIIVVIRILQMCLLCVLFIGGPIAIMMEILPPFKGSLKKWFMTYVKVHMLTPIIFIIDCTHYLLTQALGTDTIAGSVLSVVISVVLFVLYTKVEMIAGYFMEGGDIGIEPMAKTSVAIAGAGAMATAAVGGLTAGGVGVAAAGKFAKAGAAIKTAVAKAGINISAAGARVGSKMAGAKSQFYKAASDMAKTKTATMSSAETKAGGLNKTGDNKRGVVVSGSKPNWLSNKLDAKSQMQAGLKTARENMVKNKAQNIKDVTEKIQRTSTKENTKLNAKGLMSKSLKSLGQTAMMVNSMIETHNASNVSLGESIKASISSNPVKQKMAETATQLNREGRLPKDVADKLMDFGILPPNFVVNKNAPLTSEEFGVEMTHKAEKDIPGWPEKPLNSDEKKDVKNIMTLIGMDPNTHPGGHYEPIIPEGFQFKGDLNIPEQPTPQQYEGEREVFIAEVGGDITQSGDTMQQSNAEQSQQTKEEPNTNASSAPSNSEKKSNNSNQGVDYKKEEQESNYRPTIVQNGGKKAQTSLK